MPGFDGTGPQGRGPMTGGGRGFCVLKLPDRPGETPLGTAGQAGWPVGQVVAGDRELVSLRKQAHQIEVALRMVRDRIRYLAAARPQGPVGV